MADLVGRTILHYRMIQQVGEGGMGVVYKAEDTKLERVVAIKFLPTHIATSSEERERFKIEAKAAAALNHPNIATIHAIEEYDGELFIVMEYVEGRELRDIAGPGAPDSTGARPATTIDKIIDYATQIAAGLQAAHDKGVTHRDIKSANIMITEKGQVKIMDFGLAKMRGSTQITKTGVTLGTLAYMSPEQIKGEEIDHRCDLWSLGVVLFEMITGELPFREDYEQVAMYSILNDDPKPLSEWRTDIPSTLQQVVSGLLEKAPAKRYQQAEQVIGDLQSCRESIFVPRSKSRTKRFKLKRAAPLVAASAVVIVFLFWLLSRMVEIDQPVTRDQNSIAVLPFAVRGSTDFAYLGEGMVNLLSTKLDGAGDLRSVDKRALLGFLKREQLTSVDPAQARDVAQRFGASWFVLGDILELAGNLQVNGAIYKTAGNLEPAAESASEGAATELFRIVDDLAAQLLTQLATGPGARVTRIAGVTTASLPAYKAYLEGEQAFRTGRYEAAVTAFQRAVAQDSLFALAYYRLSIAAEWRGETSLSGQAAEQALRYSSRLSERDQRFLLAFVHWRKGEYASAEQIYRSLTAAYPNDVEAWIQLAEVWIHSNPFRGRSLTESRLAYERVLSYEPEDVGSMVHLARVAATEGRLAEVDSLADRILSLSPKSDRRLEILALRTFSQNDPDGIRQTLAEAEQANELELVLAVWTAAVYSLNFEQGENLCRLMAAPWRPREARILAHSWLAHMWILRGQWQAAQDELTTLETLSPIAALQYRVLFSCLPFIEVPQGELRKLQQLLTQVDPAQVAPSGSSLTFFNAHDEVHPILTNYLLGLLSAKLGQASVAEEYATKLQNLDVVPRTGSLAPDLALSIQAQIHLREGKPRRALAALEETQNAIWYPLTLSSPIYGQAFERFARAEILFQVGKYEAAIGWYKHIAEICPAELAYIPVSQMRLGEIYEKLGDNTQAISHYRRFLELWRECDLSLQPLVQRAEDRVASLQVQTTK